MRYYRCRCGEHTAWSSMGVHACAGCDTCNTTLAEHPGGHATPLPHVPVEQVTTTTRDGVTTTTTRRYCDRCGRTLNDPLDAAHAAGATDGK